MSDVTQLVIHPGKGSGETRYYLLVAETGEQLESHICSHHGFAKGDLYSNMPKRIKEWKQRFGEIVVNFIDELELTEDELMERNRQWGIAQGYATRL